MSTVISNDKLIVIGVEFRGRSVRLLGKRCFELDAQGDELSRQINDTIAKLISELRLSCLLLSQVEVGQVVLAFLKLREHAELALHRVQVTDIDKEKNNVIGILIDRCQWHVSISGNQLLACPLLVQNIDPVCEVLILADVCPPNNMPGQLHTTPSPLGAGNQMCRTQQALLSLAAPGGGVGTTSQHLPLPQNLHYGKMVMSPTSPMQQQFTFGGLSPTTAMLPSPPLVQLVSQAPPGFNPAHPWQGSTVSPMLVNYDPKGPWPKSSVVAINDMLLGTHLCGRVLREPGQCPVFYPLDPAGSGLFVADVLAERGYSLRENHRKKSNYDHNVMDSCPSLRLPAPKSPSFPFQRSNAIPASPNLLQKGNHRPLFFTRKPYPPNTREVCRITAIERGPWKFSIQLSSQAKELKALRAQLNSFQPRNIYPVEGLQPGACTVCRHSADKMLHRAVVTHAPRAGMVMVFYVDVGECDQVSVSDVFLPTKEVAEMPLLSIRSRLQGLPDTPDAKISNRFHHIVSNDAYIFVASVVKVTDDLQMSFVTLEVCAQDATSISMLDLIVLPEYTQCQLKDDDQVLVAYHDGVSDIVFFHLNENLNLVDGIQDTVDSMLEGGSCPLNRPVSPGLPCLAPHDGHYYRARIVTPNIDDTVQVFYVDYGNVSSLPLSCLLSLPPSLLVPSAQACGAVVLLPEEQSALTLPELLKSIGDSTVSVVLSGATRLHRGERVPAVHLHSTNILTPPPTSQLEQVASTLHSGDGQPKLHQDGAVKSDILNSAAQVALTDNVVTAVTSPSAHDELARSTRVLEAGSFAMCRVVHVHRNRFCVNLTQSDPLLKAIQRSVEEASIHNNSALRNFACWDIVGVHHSLATSPTTGSWHRAEVIAHFGGGCCGLNLIDVGPSVKVPLMQMFPLPVTVASISRQGVWCEAVSAPSCDPSDPSPYASLLHRVVGVYFLHRLSDDDAWQVNLFNEFRSPPALGSLLTDDLRNGARGEPKRPTRNGSTELRPCDASDNWRNKAAPPNGHHALPQNGDKPTSPITPNKISYVAAAPIPCSLKSPVSLPTPLATAPAVSGYFTANGRPLPPTPMKPAEMRPLAAVLPEVQVLRSSFNFQSTSPQGAPVREDALTASEPPNKGSNLKPVSTDGKVAKRVSFSDPIQEETVFVSEELDPCPTTLSVEEHEQPPATFGQVFNEKKEVSSNGLNYVISSLDLSVGQEITVQATWVVSPGEFWCHILGPDIDNFYKFQECFASMPRTEMIPAPPQSINIGDEVAALYSADKCWYRAKVLTIEPTVTREVFYCVQLIDFGNEDIVPAKNIALLTPDWRRLPVQGLHCRLPQLLPSGGTWSDDASELAVSLLYDGELTLRLSRRLEDDSVLVIAVRGTNGELVDRLLTEEHAEMEDGVIAFAVSSAAVETPDPGADLEAITEAPETRAVYQVSDPQPKEETIVCEIPKLTTARVSSVPTTASTPPPFSKKKSADGLELLISLDLSIEQDLKVKATWVTSPGEFWCHILGPENERFRKVQEGFASTLVSEMTPAPTINVGDKVAAMYSADKCWYRAKVLSTESSMIREVFHCVQFIDFGNEDLVPTKSIALLPQHWLDMPIQGVRCRLPHLIPSGGTWSKEAAELAVSLLYDGELTVRFSRRLEDDSAMVTAVRGTRGELVELLLAEEHADLDEELIVLNGDPVVSGAETTNKAKGSAEVFILEAEDVLANDFPAAPPLVSGENVFLCYCERGDPRDPGGPCVLLYLQRDQDTDALCALEEDIAREAQHVLTWMPVGEGEPCLALSSKDGVWYRALVLHQRGDGVAIVRYLDYGNTELIPDTDLGVAPCPFSLLKVPPLAHVCVLHRAPASFDCNAFAKIWQDKLLSVRVHTAAGDAHPQVSLVTESRSVLSEFGVLDDLPPATKTAPAKDKSSGDHRAAAEQHLPATTCNQNRRTTDHPQASTECCDGTHFSQRDQPTAASQFAADRPQAAKLTNVQPEEITYENFFTKDTAAVESCVVHVTEHVVAVRDYASGQHYITDGSAVASECVTDAQYVAEVVAGTFECTTGDEDATKGPAVASEYVTDHQYVVEQFAVVSEYAADDQFTSEEPVITLENASDGHYISEQVSSRQQNVVEVASELDYVDELPTDQQYVIDEVPADQDYVTEAVPTDQDYVTEAVPTDQVYVAEAVPTDQVYVAEAVPTDQDYVTEAVPTDQDYVTEAVPTDQDYVTEAVPTDQVYVTEAVPTDQVYVTENIAGDGYAVKEPADSSECTTDQQYVTDEVPTGQQNVPDEAPTGQQNVPDEVPTDQQYVLDEVPTGQQYVPDVVSTDELYDPDEVSTDQQCVLEVVSTDQQYVPEEAPIDQHYVPKDVPTDQENEQVGGASNYTVCEHFATDGTVSASLCPAAQQCTINDDGVLGFKCSTERQCPIQLQTCSSSKPTWVDSGTVDGQTDKQIPIIQETAGPDCTPIRGSVTSASHVDYEQCVVGNLATKASKQVTNEEFSVTHFSNGNNESATDCVSSANRSVVVERCSSYEATAVTCEREAVQKLVEAEPHIADLPNIICSELTTLANDCAVNTDVTRPSLPLHEETKVKTYAACLAGTHCDEVLPTFESGVPAVHDCADEPAGNNEGQVSDNTNEVFVDRNETLLAASLCPEAPADDNRVLQSKSSTPEPSESDQQTICSEQVVPIISGGGVTETFNSCFGPTAQPKGLVEGRDEQVNGGNLSTSPVICVPTDAAQHCNVDAKRGDAHANLCETDNHVCIGTRLIDNALSDTTDDAPEVSLPSANRSLSDAEACVPRHIGNVVQDFSEKILLEFFGVNHSSRPSGSAEYLKADNNVQADDSDAQSLDHTLAKKTREPLSVNRFDPETRTTVVLTSNFEIASSVDETMDEQLVSVAHNDSELASRVPTLNSEKLLSADSLSLKPPSISDQPVHVGTALRAIVEPLGAKKAATVTSKCPTVSMSDRQGIPCASETKVSKTDDVHNDRSLAESSRSVSSNSKTWSFEQPLKLERQSNAYLPYTPKMGEIYPVTIIQMNPDLSMIVQLKDEMVEWTEMSSTLSSEMLQCNLERLTSPVLPDSFCCARYSGDGGWYRARYLADVSDTLCYVVFFDFGSYELVDKENIYKLPEQFWVVPSQALHVELRPSDTCMNHEKSSVMTAIHGLNPDANVSAVFSKGRDGQFVVADLFVEGESLVPLMVCADCGNCAVYDEGNSDDKLDVPDDENSVTQLPPLTVPLCTLLEADVKLIRRKEFVVNLGMFTCDVTKAGDLLNFHMNVCKPNSCEVLPALGSYCAVQVFPESSWRRAELLEITPTGAALVLCFDDCSIKTVTVPELFSLPAKFSLLPAQAVRCVFSDDQSLQSKLDLVHACKSGELQLQFDSLDAEGRYVVSCAMVRGGPLLEALDNTTSEATACNLSELLPSQIFTSTRVSGAGPAFDTRYLEDVSTTDVHASEILFSVPPAVVPFDRPVLVRTTKISEDCSVLLQTLETQSEWLDVITQLKNFMVTACVLPFSCCPQAGVYCVTKNADSGEWYRGLVLGPSADDGVKVYNVDTGHVEILPVLDVFSLPQPFSLLPALCIKAKLMLADCPNHEGCTALKNLRDLQGENLFADFDFSSDGSLLVRKLVSQRKKVDLLDNCCEGSNLLLGVATDALITLEELFTKVGNLRISTNNQSASKFEIPPLRSPLHAITEEEHHSVDKSPSLVSDEVGNVEDPSYPPGEILLKDTKGQKWWGSVDGRNPSAATNLPSAARIQIGNNVPSEASKVKFGKVLHIDDSLSFSVWVLNIENVDSLNFIEHTIEEEIESYSRVENIAFRSVYAAPLEGSFHRAVVLNVVTAVNSSNDGLSVLFIDRGQRCVVERLQLRKLPDYVTELPPLAEQVFLPLRVIDARRAVEHLNDVALGQVCAFAKLAESANGGEPGLVLATEESGDLAKCLVSKGYGEYRDPGYPDIAAELEERVLELLNARKAAAEDEKTQFFTASDLEARLDVLKSQLPQ